MLNIVEDRFFTFRCSLAIQVSRLMNFRVKFPQEMMYQKLLQSVGFSQRYIGSTSHFLPNVAAGQKLLKTADLSQSYSKKLSETQCSRRGQSAYSRHV